MKKKLFTIDDGFGNVYQQDLNPILARIEFLEKENEKLKKALKPKSTKLKVKNE